MSIAGQRLLTFQVGPGISFCNDYSDGKTLNGAHEYVVLFAKGEQPPVKGFWPPRGEVCALSALCALSLRADDF